MLFRCSATCPAGGGKSWQVRGRHGIHCREQALWHRPRNWPLRDDDLSVHWRRLCHIQHFHNRAPQGTSVHHSHSTHHAVCHQPHLSVLLCVYLDLGRHHRQGIHRFRMGIDDADHGELQGCCDVLSHVGHFVHGHMVASHSICDGPSHSLRHWCACAGR